MDIEKLKRKRQKNVQEQNALKKHYMRELAIDFRESPEEYIWLRNVLTQNSLDVNQGILISLSGCLEQGPVEECSAVWISSDSRFYELIVILKYGTQEIDEIESVTEITDSIEINAHQRGTGKSFGQLAIELIRELL
ncbi:hypothetical protein [Pleionea sediminis]|uniref:hypothetical protein n=1 Tax=Pleionea sediminis TaxID=2569479 RepID=UPI0011860BBF|nr:hypothetical protein [Pleionea sediminis]